MRESARKKKLRDLDNKKRLNVLDKRKPRLRLKDKS